MRARYDDALLIAEASRASKVYEHPPWSFLPSNCLVFFFSFSSFSVLQSQDTIIVIAKLAEIIKKPSYTSNKERIKAEVIIFVE